MMDQEWENVYFSLKIKEIQRKKGRGRKKKKDPETTDYYFTFKKRKRKLKLYQAPQSMERKAALSALLNWPTEKASQFQAQTSPW